MGTDSGKKKLIDFNMKFMLLLFAMIPMGVAVIAMIVAAGVSMNNELKSETKETLKAASRGLQLYYEWDIANIGTVEYETDYVDSLKEEDIDLTLFMENVRFATSILDESGKRNEGTTASDEVWNTVKAGQDFYSDDIVIGGKDFYVYYRPIKGTDGTVLGMAFAGKPCDDVKAATNQIILMTVIIGAIVAIIFLGIVIWVSRIVVAPLKAATDAIQAIAGGDLSDRDFKKALVTETNTLVESAALLHSELGTIIGKTKDAAIALTSDVAEVTSLSTESSEASDQISVAMGELADGATLLATNVQEINSKIIEMSNVINDISDDVVMLSDSSAKMNTANEEATGYINKMAASSDKSVSAVQNITAQVSETNEAIVNINDAVTLITDIAGQTNLLALNASIEAARAGEQGKGFAVVADEIKKLAEQSNSSAEDIKRIVEEILEKSTTCVTLSKDVEEIIKEEQELLSETKDKFEILNGEINSSVNGINAISDRAETLGGLTAVVTSSVSDLSAVSEENSASNEEISASIDSIASNISTISTEMTAMNDLAKELSDTVSYFG